MIRWMVACFLVASAAAAQDSGQSVHPSATDSMDPMETSTTVEEAPPEGDEAAGDDAPTEDEEALTEEEEAQRRRRQRRSPTTTRRDPTPIRVHQEEGHQSLEVGMYLSAVVQWHPVDAPADGSDGFIVGNARLAFWGDLTERFEYLLQLEFARPTQPLLDMALSYAAFDELRFTAGLFKVPFSAEFLLPAANTTLIDRARVVAALAPNRQAGLQVSGTIADGAFSYAAGMFNGNTFDEPDALTNVDNDFFYAARVGSGLDLTDDIRLELAANVGGGREDDLQYAFVNPAPFAGSRLLVGGDLSLTLYGLLLSTEIIAGRISPDGVALPDGGWVWGLHATVGYAILDYLAVYARWDAFDTTAFGAAERSDDLILSVASGTRGSAPVNAQIDYIVPVEDTDAMKLLFNVYAVF